MSALTCTRPARPPVKEGRFLDVISVSEALIVIVIRDGHQADRYEITPACSDWGLAVRFLKVEGKQRVGEATYTVLGDAGNEQGEDQCDCTGFSRQGHCRHTAALWALKVKGHIASV